MVQGSWRVGKREIATAAVACIIFGKLVFPSLPKPGNAMSRFFDGGRGR